MIWQNDIKLSNQYSWNKCKFLFYFFLFFHLIDGIFQVWLISIFSITILILISTQTNERPCNPASTPSDKSSTTRSCNRLSCTPCACIRRLALLAFDILDRASWWLLSSPWTTRPIVSRRLGSDQLNIHRRLNCWRFAIPEGTRRCDSLDDNSCRKRTVKVNCYQLRKNSVRFYLTPQPFWQ